MFILFVVMINTSDFIRWYLIYSNLLVTYFNTQSRLQAKLSVGLDHDTAQMVGCWLLTIKVQVQSQGNLYGVCGKKCCTGVGFCYASSFCQFPYWFPYWCCSAKKPDLIFLLCLFFYVVNSSLQISNTGPLKLDVFF